MRQAELKAAAEKAKEAAEEKSKEEKAKEEKAKEKAKEATKEAAAKGKTEADKKKKEVKPKEKKPYDDTEDLDLHPVILNKVKTKAKQDLCLTSETSVTSLEKRFQENMEAQVAAAKAGWRIVWDLNKLLVGWTEENRILKDQFKELKDWIASRDALAEERKAKKKKPQVPLTWDDDQVAGATEEEGAKRPPPKEKTESDAPPRKRAAPLHPLSMSRGRLWAYNEQRRLYENRLRRLRGYYQQQEYEVEEALLANVNDYSYYCGD